MLKLSGRSKTRSRSTLQSQGQQRGDPDPKPVFYYDDCCPLCRSYTAAFTAIGLSDRQGFSTIDDEALADLDLDLARHFIPLRSPETGDVAYGLDGILGLVSARIPLLGPVVRFGPVRRTLDGAYWLITYNRRHIVAAPPPAAGFDCAPDHRTAPVVVYVALALGVATVLARITGTEPIVALSVLAALVLVTVGRSTWDLHPLQALGHVASVAVAGALGGAAVAGLVSIGDPGAETGSLVVAAATALIAGRKLWLRRWLLRKRRGGTTTGSDRAEPNQQKDSVVFTTSPSTKAQVDRADSLAPM
jgi:hypothetical protein